MSVLRRYLTTANYLSWPVVVASAGILLSGHFSDTPLNGTENVLERAGVLVVSQAIFFLALWGCDRLFLRRLPESYRWLAVWATIAILAAVWGILFTWVLWQLGYTPSFNFAPRISGWLLSLALLTVIVAMIYGLFAESAAHRRQRADIAARIRQLHSISAERQDADAAVIADIRAQLEETLALAPPDSPDKTLSALRAAIDEVIRPVTRALREQVAVPELPGAGRAVPIYWRRIARRFGDYPAVAAVAGALLFAVSSFPTVSRVMGLGPAFVVLSLVCAQLTITTLILSRLSRFLPNRMRSVALPLVLIVSAGLGAVVFQPLIPWEQPQTYYLAFILRFVLFGFIADVMAIAVDENRRTSLLIARNQADVEWAVARANEVLHYQRQLIATVLHGRWQAVLVAAAARLRIALRDGASAEEAVALARAEASTLSLKDFHREQAPRSIVDVVNETASLWEGVVDISWESEGDIVELVDADPVCAKLCGELILENGTNAIKHASATTISVSLSRVDHRVVRLVVRNNGEPYHPGQQGYGSSLLDQSCVRWSVETAGGDTIISADIPWSTAENPMPE
ncbi:MAG: hypothetical protein F2808_05770 [Actinobacteria bacterium]|nr:hypothetical protein [Actinomycetota bacterium]